MAAPHPVLNEGHPQHTLHAREWPVIGRLQKAQLDHAAPSASATRSSERLPVHFLGSQGRVMTAG
ncbi:hypothetical protein ACMX25_21915 [Caballeronia sp. 15715]